MRGAVRRITAKRKPELPGYHEWLRLNQYDFVTEQRPEVKDLLDVLKLRLKQRLDDEMLDEGELRYKWAHKAHKKRRMRINNHLRSNFDGVVHPTHTERVAYVIKPMEVLAKGKYVRAIGDLGVAASARAAFIVDYAKEIMTESIEVNDIECVFIPGPRPKDLNLAFTKLLNPNKKGFFCFFSDDSCFAYRCNDGLFICNMDISAADGSNFKPIFEFLHKLLDVDARFSKALTQVFDQNWLAARMRNPELFTEFIDMVPILDPVLYSGSVLTTLINNIANYMIFLSIAISLRDTNVLRNEIEEIIQRSAEHAGYVVRCDVCHVTEDIQFLKYSPTIVDDEVVPFLNLGAWMLKFGTFDGDLPGSKKIPLVERSRVFNSDVVKGRLQSGNHIIADAFKTMIVGKTFVGTNKAYDEKMTEIYSKGGGSTTTRIPVHQLAARYRCDPVDLELIAGLITQAGQGDLVQHPVLDVIFKKDYGI
jgi:hypothetical protein